MGQLKSKQPTPAAPPKPASVPAKSDTIAAVGSPIRPDAGPSDSFSSRKSSATRGVEPTGQLGKTVFRLYNHKVDMHICSFLRSCHDTLCANQQTSYLVDLILLG